MATLALPEFVLDNAPVGMVLIDARDEVVWANRAAVRILAPGSEGLVGRVVTAVMRPADTRSLHSDIEALRDGPGVPWESEERWETAEGRSVWLQVSASAVPPSVANHLPVLAAGRRDAAAVICQFVDITARKEAEAALAGTRRELEARNRELERSNEDLTQFAYVASHDLSEPLRVIAGHVDLLASRYSGRIDEDADRWIHFAVDGCERMRILIGDLLQYSRTGRRQPVLEEVDLAEVVSLVIHDLGSLMAESDVRLTVGPLPKLEANAGQMRQLMTNIVANALKFTRPGETAEIHISAERGRGEWLIQVADNGIGIPEEYRTRVFGIFERLHSRDRYSGSGIGLAIARRIVELHGGHIRAESSPLGGCRISFTIADRPEALT